MYLEDIKHDVNVEGVGGGDYIKGSLKKLFNDY